MLGKHNLGEENIVFCLGECWKIVAQTPSTAEHMWTLPVSDQCAPGQHVLERQAESSSLCPVAQRV